MNKFYLPNPLLLLPLFLTLASLDADDIGSWNLWGTGEVKAELLHVFGPVAYFRAPAGGVYTVDHTQLPPSEKERIAQWLADNPAKDGPNLWEKSRARFSRQFLAGQLRSIRLGEVVPVDFSGRLEPQFYVLCFLHPRDLRAPELIRRLNETLHRYEAYGLTNFAVILVSLQSSPQEERDFLLREHARGFFWSYTEPPLKLAQTLAPEPLTLLLVDREGEILHQDVPALMNATRLRFFLAWADLVKHTNPENHYARLQCLTFSNEEKYPPGAPHSHLPEPYDVTLEDLYPAEFNLLKGRTIPIKLRVTETGMVASADIPPEEDLSPELRRQLELQARCWLFYPKLDEGKPVPSLVLFPLKVAP